MLRYDQLTEILYDLEVMKMDISLYWNQLGKAMDKKNLECTPDLCLIKVQEINRYIKN